MYNGPKYFCNSNALTSNNEQEDRIGEMPRVDLLASNRIDAPRHSQASSSTDFSRTSSGDINVSACLHAASPSLMQALPRFIERLANWEGSRHARCPNIQEA